LSFQASNALTLSCYVRNAEVYYNNKSPVTSEQTDKLSLAKWPKPVKHLCAAGFHRQTKAIGGRKMLESGSIIWNIIIGGAAGAIAKFVMPGKDPGGIIVTVLLGIAGALLMGFAGNLVGWGGDGAGFIQAIVGAIILLVAYRFINKSRGGGDTLS
jgi:uncharacterized membrane protein YeaQ/YmgE (transglycosylase-associated protein family)